jgi:MFS family permease
VVSLLFPLPGVLDGIEFIPTVTLNANITVFPSFLESVFHSYLDDWHLYTSSYTGFTACQTLQGFTGPISHVIGFSIIHDLFCFHEKARKIIIWAFSFLIGPSIGPFLSGFILLGLDWRHTFGILCGFYGFSIVTIIIFGNETLYNRDGFQLPREHGIVGCIKRLIGLANLSP